MRSLTLNTSAGGASAAFEREDLDPNENFPSELVEQVFQAYRKRWQPSSRRQHKRRHSDPECYRGMLQSPLPSFPTILLPSTADAVKYGAVPFWSSTRPDPATALRTKAAEVEFLYLPSNIASAIDNGKDDLADPFDEVNFSDEGDEGDDGFDDEDAYD
jgi:hypothetical protein